MRNPGKELFRFGFEEPLQNDGTSQVLWRITFDVEMQSTARGNGTWLVFEAYHRRTSNFQFRGAFRYTYSSALDMQVDGQRYISG